MAKKKKRRLFSKEASPPRPTARRPGIPAGFAMRSRNARRKKDVRNKRWLEEGEANSEE